MAPAADQHVNDPNAVTTVMQVAPSDQLYRGREESKSARAHGKNNLHRSVSVGSQPGPSARPRRARQRASPQKIWVWSR
jgi:hypothetical protein